MTTKHTPGPWFAEKGAAQDRQWRVWDHAGIACICDVHAGVEPDPSGAIHARLIALAPAMLAVCEGLVAWWMKDGISGNATLDELTSQARMILRDLNATKK